MPDRPEIGPEEMRVWRAFTELSRQRAVGMAANPICVRDIESYLNLRQIRHPDQREDWTEIVLALDQDLLAFKPEEAEDGD